MAAMQLRVAADKTWVPPCTAASPMLPPDRAPRASCVPCRRAGNERLRRRRRFLFLEAARETSTLCVHRRFVAHAGGNRHCLMNGRAALARRALAGVDCNERRVRGHEAVLERGGANRLRE